MTAEDIRQGLTELGLTRGMRVLVHSSLSSFGWVEGGAKTVVDALMKVVGPDGTILMPSFNHGAPFGDSGPGYFDPMQTPTTNGRIPDTFWRQPRVLRSLNPTHPFAGWGRDAARYVTGHHETLTMGENSPLGLIARDDGVQLNLGTDHRTTTAKHLAETLYRSPCLGYRTEVHDVKLAAGTTAQHRTWGWRERTCPLTDSGELIQAEMERRQAQTTGRVGECHATWFRLKHLLQVVWGLLEQGSDGLPPCAECPIRPRRTASSVPSDWVEDEVALAAARRQLLQNRSMGS